MPNSHVQYTLDQVVSNMERFSKLNNGSVTRDKYRKWDEAIPESIWYRFFNDFKDFKSCVGHTVLDTEELNTYHADTWNIDFKKTRIHTLEQLLEYCQVDKSIWSVERFVVNKYEVGAKNKKDELIIEPLYQIKATLIKRKEIVNARAEIEALKTQFDSLSPFVPYRFSNSVEHGNMLEINLPDAHFGKMAWHCETGDRNYDTPIAAATFMRALKVLLKRASGYKFDKILFVVGNDLLNSDNEQGTTTKGTFVSTDGRYQKTFVTVRETITEAIKQCAMIAPVHVVLVSGNHDDLSVWHLGDSLQCIFANDENVVIDNEPTYRKYVRFGNVLLMLTHGDKGKREDYPLLMATERSFDFGDTKFREIHTGHIHQTKLQEWHGVRVRILPSLSPPDAWHSENGFTGQQRNAEAYVWNAEEGLIAQFFHNDDSYPEITTDRILKEG